MQGYSQHIYNIKLKIINKLEINEQHFLTILLYSTM